MRIDPSSVLPAMAGVVGCLCLTAAGEIHDVRAFGARGDGRTKDTEAFQRAIDKASSRGGGTVEMPTGRYLVGSLYLKSNVDLHIWKGATIVASGDRKDYNGPDVCPQNRACVCKGESVDGAHLFLCIEQTNVTVRGEGRIDGNSRAFLLGPTGERPGQSQIPWRPAQMLYFVECSGLRLVGLELVDAPYWSCFLHGCDDVVVERLDIRNVRGDFHTHNGDGIDIDCSERVSVTGCRIVTADDALTLRGDVAFLRHKRDCADVTVSDCELSSACSGIRIGVGEGCIHDATFSRLAIRDTRIGINMVSGWSPESKGVDIHDFSFSDLNVDCWMFAQMNPAFGKGRRFDGLTFRNVVGRQEIASELIGNASRPPNRIMFENVTLPQGLVTENAGDFRVKGGDFSVRTLLSSERKIRDREKVVAATRFCVRAPASGSSASAGGEWSISLPAAAKPWEATAASDLEEYLCRRLGGKKLRVNGQDRLVFHVGDTEFAKRKGLASVDLDDERWIIRSFGRDIVLNGGGRRGCLYAVSHFLEDCLEIRWWSETEENVPAPSNVSLGSLKAEGKPKFLYRDIYRTFDPMKATTRLALRRRLNRNGDVAWTGASGGAFGYGPPAHAHAFDHYLPWAEYGKTHPEWFSLVDGKRHGGGGYNDGGQLCFANSGAFRQLFLERLLANIERGRVEARAAGQEPPRLYDVSMNDNRRYCACEKCKAAAERVNPSGVYLAFVNWLAGEVAQRYPDVYLTMLAYYFTEEPPKNGMKVADNVIVKLCNTRANMAASLADDGNRTFRDLVSAWKNHAKNVFVWDYDITYTKESVGFPFASELHFADKYRLYADNNVTGIFWEQEEQDRSDLFDIKYYLKTKLFEDPSVDYPKLLERTFSEYFGRGAGPHVLSARRRLEEARVRNKGYLRWYPQIEQFDYICAEDIAFMQAEYEAAAKAAGGNAIHLRRLAKARAGLDRLAVFRQNTKKK